MASTFRRLQAAAITDAATAAEVAAANHEPDTLINLPEAAFPLFMTTRDWLKALDASCAESFFVRTPDGRLLGREIDDWDGIGLEVDLGEGDWLDDDEHEDDVISDVSSSSEEEDLMIISEEEYDGAGWDEGWEEQPAGAAAAAGGGGRRQRRRAAAAAAGGGAAAAPEAEQAAVVKHLLAHEVTYVSGMVGGWGRCHVCGVVGCMAQYTSLGLS